MQTQQQPQHDYESRYAPNWGVTATKTKKLTNGKCCLCHKPATEVHHARYCDDKGYAIAGREKPLIDVFPLCDEHHDEAHLSENWYQDKENPVLLNRNYPHYYQRLYLAATPYRPQEKPVMRQLPIIPVVEEFDYEEQEYSPLEPTKSFNWINLVFGLPWLGLLFLLL